MDRCAPQLWLAMRAILTLSPSHADGSIVSKFGSAAGDHGLEHFCACDQRVRAIPYLAAVGRDDQQSDGGIVRILPPDFVHMAPQIGDLRPVIGNHSISGDHRIAMAAIIRPSERNGRK